MAAVKVDRPTVADVAERLMASYQDSLPCSAVSSVVLTARDQLLGQVPGAAFPELLYRLADYRLAQIATAR